MNQYVSDQEAALLTLTARRLLHHTREAQKRGEEYHDMTRHMPIACGVRVKLLFKEAPGGYAPEVQIIPHPSFEQDELAKIASEIVGGRPVKLDDSDWPPPPARPPFYRYKVTS